MFSHVGFFRFRWERQVARSTTGGPSQVRAARYAGCFAENGDSSTRSINPALKECRHHHKTATLAQSASVKPPSEPKAGVAAQNAKSEYEEMIRLRAYQKWEAAGKPQGNGVQFWVDAEQELLMPKKVGSA